MTNYIYRAMTVTEFNALNSDECVVVSNESHTFWAMCLADASLYEYPDRIIARMRITNDNRIKHYRGTAMNADVRYQHPEYRVPTHEFELFAGSALEELIIVEGV